MATLLHRSDCALMSDARAEKLADGCTCGGIDRDALAFDCELHAVRDQSRRVIRFDVMIRVLGQRVQLNAVEAGMFALRIERTAAEAGQRSARLSERAATRGKGGKDDG